MLRISKPGFTTVERTNTESRGSFAEVLDARLTLKSDAQVIPTVLGDEIAATGTGDVTPPVGRADDPTPALATVEVAGTTALRKAGKLRCTGCAHR